MYGLAVGLPAALFVALWIYHTVEAADMVHNHLASTIMGLSTGLFIYYMARGIDIWLERKKDNPEPFYTALDLPLAYGNIKRCLTEGSYGPFFWTLKTTDNDEGRIMGALSFTELMGPGFSGPPLQAKRLMMVQILFEPVPEEEQKPIPTIPNEKGRTKIDVKWLVDSPLNRYTVNKIIDEMTSDFKQNVYIETPAKREVKSAFEPPVWVLVVLALSWLYGLQQMDVYTKAKEARAAQEAARKEQIETARAAQETQQRDAAAKREAYFKQQQDAAAARQAYEQQQQEAFNRAREAQQQGAQELNNQQRNGIYAPLNRSNSLDLARPRSLDPFVRRPGESFLFPKSTGTNGN